WHARPGGPVIGLRVVLEGQIHGCPVRVPSKHVQFATGHRGRGVIERERQGLDELPAVSHELIRFDRLGLAAAATEAANHIHLVLEGSTPALLTSFLEASPPEPRCFRSRIRSWQLSGARTSCTAASHEYA